MNALLMIGKKQQIDMKISLRTGIAAGVVVAATGVLLAITNYMDNHRVFEITCDEPAVMSGSLTAVKEDMAIRMEAEEVATVIGRIDTISLSSYYELQEARALYESASDAARAYIDESQLIEAEKAYAELERKRKSLLSDAMAQGDLDGILDYAACNIQYSGDANLDSLVQELIQDAVTPGMSRSEQLRACYDYMIRNYDYGYNYNYSYGNGKKSVAWATAILRDGYGACNNWSSAFMYVARALGYEVDLYYGRTAASRGGSAEHYWPVIRIEGMEYVFDPQVEGDITRRTGVIAYKRFGLSEAEADGKYFFQQIVE